MSSVTDGPALVAPWTAEEVVADLRTRLTDAAAVLSDSTKGEVCCAYSRLSGKRQGVLLALDYLRSYDALTARSEPLLLDLANPNTQESA